jgi:RNA polymerase sigma-70 factor (ECF subfamily)
LEASDAELLRRARSGDENAFNSLMRRHEDKTYALCYRMMGNRADALDALQDTFVAVFRRADNFRGESAFSTWLYRVAANSCKDALRKKGRSPIPQEEISTVDDRGPGVEEQVALRMDLAQALAQLPDEYREAVVMHDIGGVPYDEIATLTGAAIGTVKSRISRGRRKLAGLLEHGDRPATSKDQR